MARSSYFRDFLLFSQVSEADKIFKIGDLTPGCRTVDSFHKLIREIHHHFTREGLCAVAKIATGINKSSLCWLLLNFPNGCLEMPASSVISSPATTTTNHSENNRAEGVKEEVGIGQFMGLYRNSYGGSEDCVEDRIANNALGEKSSLFSPPHKDWGNIRLCRCSSSWRHAGNQSVISTIRFIASLSERVCNYGTM